MFINKFEQSAQRYSVKCIHLHPKTQRPDRHLGRTGGERITSFKGSTFFSWIQMLLFPSIMK